MNYNELQEFIKSVAKSGATEVEIEMEDLKLSIKVPPKGKAVQTEIVQVPVAAPVMAAPQVQQAPLVQQAPVAQPAAAPAPAAEEKEEDSKYITIKAPMVGTFYRRPNPEKPLFVNVGDDINEGDVICILEAMKLFNEIEAEVSGKIVKVLVEDSTPVEFDQPLFLVEPA